MTGLFLQGGGAKGAFQAGVIYGLYERGLEFNIISGTSIGAINSYFIYKNSMNELKYFWNNVEYKSGDFMITDKKVVENQQIINILSNLQGENDNVESVYVNYVKIDGDKLKEISIDIANLKKEEQLDIIKYSSLLPNASKALGDDGNTQYNSNNEFEKFGLAVKMGLYDGYNLDGGILNNIFLEPFIENKVDKLVIITFTKDFEPPKYILDTYSREQMVIVEPKNKFKPTDTMNFDEGFRRKLFKEGYELSKKVSI
ncbi:patatin-like phospholipase family protein [Dethiothermospora halolimnae]|uniref:patatin-like phospholipase family protein n=1 Tax=Dethiothermospora halolimnae TaxID=3114390 RepID=UPI003CCBF385